MNLRLRSVMPRLAFVAFLLCGTMEATAQSAPKQVKATGAKQVKSVSSKPAKEADALPLKKVYDEQADATAQLDEAIAQAQASGRYVLVQVGGNWCPWCLRFAHFADTNQAVHQLLNEHFVYTHINYSKDNRNPEAMQRLGNPARFGFPVFVVLNGDGEVLHLQNSSYLEEGKGYSVKKVVDCFSQWTPAAVTTLK